MKYQTDYPDWIQREGCLLCSLVTACEQLVSVELSREHFIELVGELHFEARCRYDPRRPVLSDEADLATRGAFVWDHEELCDRTLRRLGSMVRIRYTGRLYMPHWRDEHRWDFGSAEGADFVVLHIRTPNTGHFRLPDFDPWKPGTKMLDLKSVRYYKVR